MKRNKRRPWIVYAVVIIAVIGGFMFFRMKKDKQPDVTYRTAPVTRETVMASVSANGVIQPMTTVEVKSNVGGQIVELAVDEGDYVRAGQLIARIDPSDSVTNLEQSEADYAGAIARVNQAEEGKKMTRTQTAANIRASEQGVESAKQRLVQAEKQASIQPELSAAAIAQAESNLASAESSLQQLKTAIIPQKIASAKASYDQAKASFAQAKSNLARQKALLEKGFIAKSQYESAQEQFAVAKAQLDSASNKWETVNNETAEDIRSAEAKIAQAKASLATAKANRVQDSLKQQDVAAARAALRQAEANLESAKANSYQERMKQEEVIQAQSQVARARASVENAKTQLNYTTIVAPSDGVVVKKYAEEGSIVVAGRSSFSGSGAGVTIIDIATVDRMEVQVNVDETDIGQIRIGQMVDIEVDAYPDDRFTGAVSKIAPKAVLEQNVTLIPVTVAISQKDTRLKPEMNATCDFVIDRKADVVSVPSAAVKETPRGYMVKVMVKGKPEKRRVTVGIEGDDRTEIISGVREGEEVVTAEISTKPPQPGAPGGGGRRGPMRGPGGGG